MPCVSPAGARCGWALVTAVALPLFAWLAEVSVDASISVLGFDAFGAGIELHGQPVAALLLGALWGAGAGAVGALLAYVSGAAGWRAVPLALGDAWAGSGGAEPAVATTGAVGATGVVGSAAGQARYEVGPEQAGGGSDPYPGAYPGPRSGSQPGPHPVRFRSVRARLAVPAAQP